MSQSFAKLLIAVALALSTQAGAQTPTPAPAEPAAQPRNDYGKAESWLCRPGRQDACAVDLSTTVVAANGALSRETFVADPKAPIDCFYVYPTVSLDTTPNSDMTAGPEELSVVTQQFARFASQCRVYAPLYRQVTLTALRSAIAGKAMAADRVLAYSDVLDAWNYYLQHDNQGRGVVLVGHSQGSGVLNRLIASEIDGKPVQSKIVSALLIGTNVAVPAGKDVGGAFQKMPLCKSSSQTGCVIAYVTFRDTIPPPENSRFGKVPGESMTAACVNPAALGGGTGTLHSYLAARGRSLGNSNEPSAWVASGANVEAPFVSVPGLLSAQCVAKDGFSYLSVTVHSDPSDPRTDDIVGDVVVNGAVQKDWGLHLIDVNVAMGNLLDVVALQSRAYTAHHE